jgi:hypothetical protein
LLLLLLQVDEDEQLSQPARIDLSQLLSPAYRITAITELSLTANRCKADMPRPRAWKAEQEPIGASKSRSGSDSSKGGGGTNTEMPAASGLSWGSVKSMCSRGSSRYQSVVEQEQQQQQQQQGGARAAGKVYDIWEHPGDDGPVFELYPMEIRTWLVEVEA